MPKSPGLANKRHCLARDVKQVGSCTHGGPPNPPNGGPKSVGFI